MTEDAGTVAQYRAVEQQSGELSPVVAGLQDELAAAREQLEKVHTATSRNLLKIQALQRQNTVLKKQLEECVEERDSLREDMLP